ncbi:MAG: hypothetical protein BWK80_09750 [Desulfobacteraceae bacterium IS3]|nr:MAG: hypothetical protein BWK80_09750 [Desulfobacteraceae bacterium IS3]
MGLPSLIFYIYRSYAVEYCFFLNRKVTQSFPQSYAKFQNISLRNSAVYFAKLCGQTEKANFNCVSPDINDIIEKICKAF